MEKLTSRPYKPSPMKACETCVFGRGEHAEWCLVGDPLCHCGHERGRLHRMDGDESCLGLLLDHGIMLPCRCKKFKAR